MSTRKSAKYLTSLYQAFGRFWEQEVSTWLSALGFDVRDCGGFSASFDLYVNDALVEVKAAHKTEHNNGKGTLRARWQFNLSSKRKTSKRYFAVLVALDDNDNPSFFFIPGDAITTSTIQITSAPEKYRGKWSKYLNDHTHLERWLASE